MRKIKALIYALLGGMVAWAWLKKGEPALAALIIAFTLAMIALTLSSIGRIEILWNQEGITIKRFPKKAIEIRWDELENIKLDHLGYHITARTGRFKIRKQLMPEDLLTRIKSNIRKNKQGLA